jgi:hypothetical protein
MSLLPARFAMPDDLGLPLGVTGHDDATVALAQSWRRHERPDERAAREAKAAECKRLTAFERGDHMPDREVKVSGAKKFVIKTRLVPMSPLAEEDVPAEMREQWAREAPKWVSDDVPITALWSDRAGQSLLLPGGGNYANGAANVANLTWEKVKEAETRLREILGEPMTEARSQTAGGLALLARADGARTAGMAQQAARAQSEAFWRWFNSGQIDRAIDNAIRTGVGMTKTTVEPEGAEDDGLPEMISGQKVWRLSEVDALLPSYAITKSAPAGAVAFFEWHGTSDEPPEIPKCLEWAVRFADGHCDRWTRTPTKDHPYRWDCRCECGDIVRVWLRPAAKKGAASA